MTVKALMSVRRNLVAPLAHEATAMHATDTAALARAASGAAPALIGHESGLRSAGVERQWQCEVRRKCATVFNATRTARRTSCGLGAW